MTTRNCILACAVPIRVFARARIYIHIGYTIVVRAEPKKQKGSKGGGGGGGTYPTYLYIIPQTSPFLEQMRMV